MKYAFLITGAAALGLAAPALAKPGKGQGQGHGNPHAYGIAGPVGVGVGGCPPGLAKKGTNCMPPGQYKKMYGVGQRFPAGYGYPWTYNQIPYDLRTHYAFDPASRYYYGDGYVYRVDPRTMLISQVVSAVLR